ncbi:MAG: 50S ribosomal protein L29 [Actinomycetia bacterium]|nr:50S ribosomal protein L29 [Actinomycetes bacterium]
MKTTDIHTLKDEELTAELKNSRTELFNLRFRLATGQLEDTSKIPAVKKDIARLCTELRARERANEQAAVGKER